MEIHYGRKRKGIKKELIEKINDWTQSIDNEEVKLAIIKDTIVTGGSIASMLLGEKINDFDIYFRTFETTKLVAEYYVNKFNENHETEFKPEVQINDDKRVSIYIKSFGVAGEDQSQLDKNDPLFNDETLVENSQGKITDNKEKYRPVFLSQNAITLSNKLQIVIRFYGEPNEIHKNYDFVHATCYWDHLNMKLELPPKALECLLSRTLIYQGSLYPIASIFRAKKFIERGWRITAGQLLKIMWQISELDLTNEEIIKEQLTGVDMAYLWQLTEALKSTNPEKINSTYVAIIIDRIFE